MKYQYVYCKDYIEIFKMKRGYYLILFKLKTSYNEYKDKYNLVKSKQKLASVIKTQCGILLLLLLF